MFSSEDHSRSNDEARVQEGRQRYHRQEAEKKKEKEDRIHQEFPPEEWAIAEELESRRMQYEVDDKAWVHWEYSPEEWALFDRVDWQAVWLRYSLPLLVALVLMVLLGCFIIFSAVAASGILSGILGGGFAVIMIGYTFLLPLFLRRLSSVSYREAKARHKAREREPRTVTFARKGVWEAGAFFPITEHLKNVTLTFDPPVLHFRLMMPAGRSSEKCTLHVLVPRRQEEEAGFFLERFETEIIQPREQARARLEKELKSPPEPR